MSIFKERAIYWPSEYPQLEKFVDAITQSFWVHTEFNIDADINDILVNLSLKERSAVERSMLALSQIEVSVKTFWGKIHDRLPKPEINDVGATFSESEVRHSRAYKFILERMGMKEAFLNIPNIPALNDRMEYLKKDLKKIKNGNDEDFTLSILLFSSFIEHISLFSQFLILLSFKKHKNYMKSITNIVSATSKEEDIHGKFGVELIRIIKEEKPEWFGKEMEEKVIAASRKAMKAEMKVLDWILEEGELDFMGRADIEAFLKDRFNSSLRSIGYDGIFEVDKACLKNTKWFYEEMGATAAFDFFDLRPTNYSKMNKSVTADDLF